MSTRIFLRLLVKDGPASFPYTLLCLSSRLRVRRVFTSVFVCKKSFVQWP